MMMCHDCGYVEIEVAKPGATEFVCDALPKAYERAWFVHIRTDADTPSMGYSYAFAAKPTRKQVRRCLESARKIQQ